MITHRIMFLLLLCGRYSGIICNRFINHIEHWSDHREEHRTPVVFIARLRSILLQYEERQILNQTWRFQLLPALLNIIQSVMNCNRSESQMRMTCNLISCMIHIYKSCCLRKIPSWLWRIGWDGFLHITIQISPIKA